jgi:GNAT superfamily N-acetyltransferase
VGDVQAAADSNKNALGFLPERVYKEAAEQGKLLVAVARNNRSWIYAGHLLHGGIFPQAKVVQLFTVSSFRRQGIGRVLVEALVRKSEDLQFMSIVARVAEDLAANQFWKNLSFEVVRKVSGGRTTGRHINVRLRELNTPRLFSLMAPQSHPSAEELKLISRLFNLSPVYVLDLNILYDLVKRRTNADDVGRIIGASFNNLVRLSVTEEFIRELERTSRTSLRSPSDPILELALRLPRLTAPPQDRLNGLTIELGTLIFGKSAGSPRTQDASDLIHLGTAIHHGASGFITGEKAILRARDVLQSKYGLDVLGASEFASVVEPTDSATTFDIKAMAAGQILQARPIADVDVPRIQIFLIRMGCPQTLIQDALAQCASSRHRRLAILCEEQVIAFGFWEIPSGVRPQMRAFLCVDEDHSAVSIAADFILDLVSRESATDHPTQLSLRLLPGHVATRRIAISHGFRPPANEPANGTNLEKIALKVAVTPANWTRVRYQLKKEMGLELPLSIPYYESLKQRVSVIDPTGQTLTLPLDEIESLLSPSIFFLPNRPGAIVPIKRVHAANLLGGDTQLSMLVSPEAVLLTERVYFSDPRTANILRKGTPVLFYESLRKGGRGCVTATARIIRSEIVSKDGANQDLLRRGVLDKKGLRNICLAKTVVATTIDNIMLFKKPVLIARLRSLGAIDGTNLVTARALSAERIIQIVDEGTS